MRFALAILVLIAGVLPPLKQHFEYVATSACFSTYTLDGVEYLKVKAGPNFKCTGTDKENLACVGEMMTTKDKFDDCLSINVVKDK